MRDLARPQARVRHELRQAVREPRLSDDPNRLGYLVGEPSDGGVDDNAARKEAGHHHLRLLNLERLSE